MVSDEHAYDSEGPHRIVVTVQASDGHEGRLKVGDAMRQVLDFLRIAEDAQVAFGDTEQSFEWYLDSASTNSPFTVVAVAEAARPCFPIGSLVDDVKRLTANVVSGSIQGEPLPGWLTPEGVSAVVSILKLQTFPKMLCSLSLKSVLHSQKQQFPLVL